MERDESLYHEAVRMALRVGFLESKEEFNMYAKALYEAMLWGIMESKKVIKSD